MFIIYSYLVYNVNMMKGVLFTTDAIFSLIIVAFAITVLAYFEFSPTSTILASSSKAQSILGLFTNTNLINILPQSSLNNKIFYQSQNSYWQQYGSDSSKSNGASSGPQYPYLMYEYYSQNGITSPIIGGYGNLYFGSNSQIYAINLTRGTVSWEITPFITTNTMLDPKGFAAYSGMLFYVNGTQLHSIYPNNGTVEWSYALPANYLFSTQPLVYNGKIILGAYSGSSSQIYSIDASSGILSWNSLITFPANGLSVINGSILVNGLNGNLIELNNVGTEIWSASSAESTTNISVSGSTAYMGSNKYMCGITSMGTNSFCIGNPTTIYSTTGISNTAAIYSNLTVIMYETSSYTNLWSYSNTTFGQTMGYSIVANNTVYSTWSNGYLSALKLSSGTLMWSTKLPSSSLGSLSLSDGILSIASGNYLYSFGSCFSNISSSIAYTLSNLFANKQGSCATYLSYATDPSYNYTIQLNGNYAFSNTLYSFNGLSYLQMNYPLNSGSNLYLGSGGTGISLGTAFTSNTWYLVGFVNNVTGNKLTTYVNGNAISTTTSLGTQSYSIFQWIYPALLSGSPEYIDGINIIAGSANSLFLGCESISPCIDGFNGIITNLQIYSGDISQSQLYSLYNGGISAGPIQNVNLYAWLPLDGGTNDFSGMGNTGYAFNINTVSLPYTVKAASSSSQISQASAIFPISNNQQLTGVKLSKANQPLIYKLGVYTWN